MILVEITHAKPSYWYKDRIGERFAVKRDLSDKRNFVVLGDPAEEPTRLIGIEDARVVTDDDDIESVYRAPLANLTLIAPGSRGKIGEIDILITQVHIESRQVEYTISWWDDGRRYSERVPEYEITEAEHTMKVGFK